MLVRQLYPNDIATFRRLLVAFGDSFGDMQTYAAAQPSDGYLAHLLGQDHFIALAAIEDDDIVGGIAAYELKKFEQERSEIYIYDLAVVERRRRQGIATALITKLKAIARHRGVYVIYVQADLVDDPAIALYSKLGRREDVLHFDIDVD